MNARPGISKYFIAIMPPPPIAERAHAWKEHFNRTFNSKAALNSPPHITLHMPFEWKTDKEPNLRSCLQSFAQTQNKFDVELDAFECFAPRVIYIRVIENAELNQLQNALARFCKTSLKLFNANRLNQPYHPHLTVAFRDLKKPLFPEAWASVKDLSFSARFTCSTLVLLKREGKQWHPIENFDLADD
jgi:2'-5' RNA ligase